MEKVIEVKNLSKKYKELVAVSDISFDVYRGEVFGLLGENGAGKTTTLEIIEGLRQPTAGEIIVLGHDIKHGLEEIKEKIGVQLQSSAYYQFLKLKEIIELFGDFYKKSLPAEELLEMVGLKEKANSYVRNLSGGQQQRFSIVASLVNDPELVFLDEPTTGLDPLARRNLWDIIRHIKEKGKTIVLTTHYMEEAEILCDRVAIMEQGKIIVAGQTHQLVEQTEYPYIINFSCPGHENELAQEISQLVNVKKNITRLGLCEIRLNDQEKVYQVLEIIHKYRPTNLKVAKTSLEDLFIELTGKTINEDAN